MHSQDCYVYLRVAYALEWFIFLYLVSKMEEISFFKKKFVYSFHKLFYSDILPPLSCTSHILCSDTFIFLNRMEGSF